MRRLRTGVAGALTALGLATGVAYAGKPGGGSTPPGTLYFASGASNAVSSMDADGGGKTSLGLSGAWSWRATRWLHGGKRWFLRAYAPTGETLRSLFLTREDGGAEVRLTNDPSLLVYTQSWDFASDESATGVTLGGCAMRVTGVPGSIVAGSAGFYFAHLAFDGSGSPLGLDAAPTFQVSVGTVAVTGTFTGDAPDADTASLSPDLGDVVCDRRLSTPRTDIRTIDVATGATITVATAGTAVGLSGPAWSSDGTKIAFVVSGSDGVVGIDTVSATGTGRARILSGRANKDSYSDVRWSPDSQFIGYTKDAFSSQGRVYDVCRVPAAGGTEKNLTSDVAAAVILVDWR